MVRNEEKFSNSQSTGAAGETAGNALNSSDKSESSQWEKSSKLAALNDKQLKKLAREAARKIRWENPDKYKEYQKNRRGRMRFRVILWGAELLILLIALKIFVLDPLWKERESDLTPIAQQVSPGWEEELPEMGDQALVLTGLREVTARRPSLSGLADGAEEAWERQHEYSQRNNLPIEVENSIGMRFRLIPPGEYMKGSPKSELGHWKVEKLHSAEVVKPLYVSKYEVTQGQWQALMESSPSRFTGVSRPVEEVNWYDSQRFVDRLEQKEAVAEGVYRLPTETEWEYICRSGTRTAYVCGDDPELLGKFAVYKANSRGTSEVGRLRPNAFGVHDMHGNVWEWCQDFFKHYPGVKIDNDPNEGVSRNIRGGHWREKAINCRSASRTRLGPESKGNMLGFRIIRRIPELDYAGRGQ